MSIDFVPGKEKETETVPEVYEVKNFVDISSGRSISCFVGLENNSVMFRGNANVNVSMMTPQGPMSRVVNFEFNIPVESIQEAFNRFDEFSDPAFEVWKKEQEEKAKAARVVGARAVPKIVTP